LRGLPGVEYAEGFRNVSVRLHYQQHSYRTGLEGLPANSRLRHLLNADLKTVRPPSAGILLSAHLGKILGAGPGDTLTVEVLEGGRRQLQVPVAALTEQYLGTGAYMQREAVNRLMDEGPAITGAYLSVDQAYADEIYRKLQQMPRIAGVSVRQATIDSFNETLARNLLTFTFINALLGTVVAFGVVYNILRISLSERSRELASLRVLGYTRFEVAYILLGEMIIIVLAGTPLGFGIGYLLSYAMVTALQSDLYRVPLVMEPDTFGLAAMTILVSASISAVIMWRKVKHLDLISVLKAKE
jgi:putative ABC transport system permease protein